jgi:hypothetical protein
VDLEDVSSYEIISRGGGCVKSVVHITCILLNLVMT